MKLSTTLRRNAMRAMACAVPATFAASYSAAQSDVALYGGLDGSVVASRSGTASLTSISSGVGFASFWGIRGAEDLGGGYKGVFQLEAGLELDSGLSRSFTGDYSAATPTAPNGPPGTGFNRRTHAGLGTPFGTFLLGREYTPVYYAAGATDAMRLQYLGNLQAVLTLTGGAEREARASNGLFYTSPLMSGLRTRAFYSLGSESQGGAGRPPKGANQFYGIGMEHVAPSLTVSGSYQVLKLPLTAGTPRVFTTLEKRVDWMLGARYTFGNFSVSTGHFQIDAPAKGTNTWLGGSYVFGPSMISAQIQRLRQNNQAGAERRATALGVVYAYSLSKRTTLYATYGRTSNNGTAQFGVTGNDVSFAAGAPGADPAVTAFGIRHAF